MENRIVLAKVWEGRYRRGGTGGEVQEEDSAVIKRAIQRILVVTELFHTLTAV